jgi:peptidoglycan hydrolase CwlO-like protein
MASFGKKILSAFVEVTDNKKPVEEKQPVEQKIVTAPKTTAVNTAPVNSKFKDYFNKLFADANIQGPDYFEFSKMIEAMNSIPDEKARYSAAFAGLQVQGLDRQRLLSTADQYVQVLNADAASFLSTVDAALQEKVHQKKQEAEEKNKRIQQLSQEINELQSQITMLQQEITENEEKIESNTGSYKVESENMKHRIQADIEKIKQYI